MTERRFDGRYMCADLVRLDWLAAEGEIRSVEAVLEDISSKGACIQTEDPLPLGVTALLCMNDAILPGEVCYCNYRDYGYFVGVRFSGGTTWSVNVAVPRHLTNLRELCIRETDASVNAVRR